VNIQNIINDSTISCLLNGTKVRNFHIKQDYENLIKFHSKSKAVDILCEKWSLGFDSIHSIIYNTKFNNLIKVEKRKKCKTMENTIPLF
jgi:hypothetical protein